MPHLTTDESNDMPNINNLGKNYRKSDQHSDKHFSDTSICCEYKRVDFYYYEKTKRNRVCGGPRSYSPSGGQNFNFFGLRINPLNFAFTLGICGAQIERIPLPINHFQPSTRRTLR